MRGLLVLLAVACSSQTISTSTLSLDRPSDITFGCITSVEDDAGTASAAVSLSTCASLGVDAGADAGVFDGGVGADASDVSVARYAFIVQPPQGTVAVASLEGLGSVRDSDPLTPGTNSLPVGRLPVGIATTANGCHAVTANAGSCDLGVINVYDAIAGHVGVVYRLLVQSAGTTLAVRPKAIVAPPPQPESEVCAAGDASGYAYVAFPACDLVGVVDLGTGSIVAGIKNGADGEAEITGSEVTCPVECGDLADGSGGEVSEKGPSVLAMEPDGSRLYMAFLASPELLVASLDAEGLPTALATLAFEGAPGITRLAATGEVGMGNGGAAGDFRFVYAIAADGAIHVADVTSAAAPRECDTQIDPRYLHDVRGLKTLSCLDIGYAPRRGDVDGPGIRLPNGAAPRDIAFIKGTNEVTEDAQPEPGTLSGLFAIVTAENPLQEAPRGVAYYINVNDENYEDLEDLEDARLVDMVLALPHSLRDGGLSRRQTVSECGDYDEAASYGPPRVQGDPGTDDLLAGYGYNATVTLVDGELDLLLLPMLHREECPYTDDSGIAVTTPVWELGFAASDATRELMLADLARALNESWVVSWEGALTLDEENAVGTGGEVSIDSSGTTMTLRDRGGPFCELGAEEGDIVTLLGCESDADCGLDETCYVHPDAPQGVIGMCFTDGTEAQLAETCKDFLTSQRRYTALEVGQSHLVLAERPYVLAWTPADGCVDDTQCASIREMQAAFLETASGAEPGSVPRYEWGCVATPTFRIENQCVMQCETTVDCIDGAICDGGICIEGPLPPPACISALERYDVRAGEAFSVVGSRSGYLHRRVLDVASGLCVDDLSRSELLVGRFHRDEAACPEAGLTALLPNPCSLTLSEPVEEVVTSEDGTVSSGNSLRESYGIRFRSLGVTFDIADVLVPVPGYPLDRYSPIPSGYRFGFDIYGGFSVHSVSLTAYLPERIRSAPDGTLWIVDSGDEANGVSNGSGRGQVIHFIASETGVDELRLY